ncbi:MAG: rod shape-determining protein [Thermodesulfobacteriota bacterium]
MAEEAHDNGPLLLGIDLGSATTAVVSSRGYRAIIPSVVGYPKDIIAIKLLGKTQVFGDEALANPSALTIYHPLREAVVHHGSRQDYNSAAELLRHVIGLATEGEPGPARAIIAAPPRITPASREALQSIASELLDAALVIADPIMVAYHLDQLDKSLIVDIGATSTVVCAVKGTVPGPQDRAILAKAGDYLDDRLQAMLEQRHPEARVSRVQARRLKEEHGFVGAPPAPVSVTLRAQGKPRQYEVSGELGQVCESIVPEIVEQLIVMLKGFDPEDQDKALQHIFLAGGGARLRGLGEMIARGLRDYGQARVRLIEEPEFAGARGALRLAGELPPERWREYGVVASERLAGGAAGASLQAGGG